MSEREFEVNGEAFDENDEDNIIVLTDENGEETEFELVDVIQYEEKEYVVLLPTDENAEEVLIMNSEATDNEDEDILTPVEDEKTLQAVYEIFKEHAADLFDFED